MKTSLKIIILVALLIGLETQLVAYYSTAHKANVIDSTSLPSKQIDDPISSNIIMVWSDNGKPGYHNFDHTQAVLLQKLAQSLSSKQFDELMNHAKHMTTSDFIAYVKEKEDTLLNPRMAKIN